MSLRRTGLQRRTELKRGTALRRTKQLARVAAGRRVIAKAARRTRDTGPSKATKALLWQRANGCCEVCGRDLADGRYPFSRHHRRPRGSGGSSVPWINDVTNLLLLCGSATTPDGCHAWVETHPAQAYTAGWKVRLNSLGTPAETPVAIALPLIPGSGRRYRSTWFYFTPDGQYEPVIPTDPSAPETR